MDKIIIENDIYVKDIKYTLFAIIYHSGYDYNKGHYFTVVKDSKGK